MWFIHLEWLLLVAWPYRYIQVPSHNSQQIAQRRLRVKRNSFLAFLHWQLKQPFRCCNCTVVCCSWWCGWLIGGISCHRWFDGARLGIFFLLLSLEHHTITGSGFSFLIFIVFVFFRRTCFVIFICLVFCFFA